MNRTRPVRVVRYYPRALAGDGGMTNAVRCWSEGTAAAGADVTLMYAGGQTPPLGRYQGQVRWIPVRHVGWRKTVVPVGLARMLRGADVLVLHSAWTLHNVWAALVARRLRVPYILEPRGAYDPHIVHRRRALKWLWWLTAERNLVKHARAIHLFFEPERPHLRALGYVGDVVIAPNGVETPDGIVWDGGSGGYVLWLGRFDPEHKGIDLVLQSMHLLSRQERPRILLHGPDSKGGKNKVRRMVADFALEPWVTVGNSVHGQAKFDLLAHARGFVYPSRWEGFGNSVAEAAAVGVPTVVTPYPFGVYLGSRDAAITVEATPQGLADGLRSLSSPRAPEIGRQAAQIMREEFTWEGVTRSWLAQVEALL
jgi:glycosyltransferase involved in cell wall biosynthesis